MLRLNVIDKKQCSKCMKFLSLCMFYKRGDGKQSLRSHCKICLRNSDNKKKSDKKYYDSHRDKILEQKKEYSQRLDVKKHRKQYMKYWASENKSWIDAYNFNNREYINQRDRNRYHNDVNFKLRKRLRGRLWDILTNDYINPGSKGGSAVRDLGCSIKYFKKYLENQFYPHPKTGEIMTWKNWGVHGWHIDHIIPLSAFNLTDKDQFQKAVHYTNLQPLWAEENLAKNDRIDRDFF